MMINVPRILLIRIRRLQGLRTFPILHEINNYSITSNFVREILSNVHLGNNPFEGTILIRNSRLRLMVNFQLRILSNRLITTSNKVGRTVRLCLVMININLLIPNYRRLRYLIETLTILRHCLENDRNANNIRRRVNVVRLVTIRTRLCIINDSINLHRSRVGRQVLTSVRLLRITTQYNRTIRLEDLIRRPYVLNITRFVRQVRLNRLRTLSTGLHHRLLERLTRVSTRLYDLILLLALRITHNLTSVCIRAILLRKENSINNNILTRTMGLNLTIVVVRNMVNFTM